MYMMRVYRLKALVAALVLSIMMSFACEAAVTSLNDNAANPPRREYANETLETDGIELTQSITVSCTMNHVRLVLGSAGIKLHSQNSLLVFKNRSTLEASADFAQYNGDDVNYNKSYVAIDGTLLVKPMGHTITLPRVKAYTDKKASILVLGEGELVAPDAVAHNVTIVRPEDVKGMIISLEGAE